MKTPNVAIFASGRGSNARELHLYSVEHQRYKVSCIISNRSNAGVLEYAKDHQIPSLVINKAKLNDPEFILNFLREHQIDFIALAGFLLLIPPYLVKAYPKRMLNIHPAILPLYGGKGMYGHHVHKAVSDHGDSVHGITIHFVNEHYDEGSIVFQAKRQITPNDDPDRIGSMVLALEHKFYPKVLAGVSRRLVE